MPLPHTKSDAFETYGTLGAGPLVVTCEHACNRIPRGIHSKGEDKAWLATHWGYDIGARTVARELVRRTGSYAVLTRFSRLVCDANRPPHHRDFIRTHTEGWPLTFNRAVPPDEVERRRLRYFEPYHAAVDEALSKRLERPGDLLLVSVHSFTPIWSGRIRTMDIGVLVDHAHQAVGLRLADEFKKQGFEPAMNQPYSAIDGMTYAVSRHGTNHNVVYLELELNQSLVCTAPRARKVARRIAEAVSQLRFRTRSRS